MTEIEWIIIMACGIGLAYTSYRIGFKDGTSSMIDFCKNKSNNGYTLMHFFGENIEFIDPLNYNRAVLEKIVEKFDEDDEQRS